MRWGTALLVLLLAGFAVVSSIGTSTRGIIAEEVAPYLRRHTLVLEAEPCAAPPSPPYEPGAPAGPRLYATSSWPIVAYDGESRMWPVLVRAYQSAIAAYVGIALGPALGGGIAGVRRSTILLGCLIILFTAAFARRTSRAHALWAAAILATSFGMIASSRTGYGFELGSRESMMGALALLAPQAPPGRVRAGCAGLLAAIAIASRATIALAVVPALAVLLWKPERRSGGVAARVIALGTALLLPVIAFAVIVHLAPLRSGTGPLASLVPSSIGRHLALIPRLALVHLAWLGDSTSIWGPLYTGRKSLGLALWPAAGLGALVVTAAVVRARRRTAGEGEKMLLAAGATTVAAAAFLYRDGNQFQLALPLEPLFALAAAEQVVAAGKLAVWRAPWVAGAFVVIARLQGTARGMTLDAGADNPMLSGAAQRAASSQLAELGARGPEVVTTTYNHAGVVEAWTNETVRPVHAWPLFVGVDEDGMRSAWRRILATYHPRYVLLTEGTNLVEGGDTNVKAIERTLDEVAASGGLALTRAAYRTEGGAPGWAIVTVHGVMSPVEGERNAACGARPDQSLPSFGGVRVGDRLDDCEIRRIDPAGGKGGARFSLTCPQTSPTLYATHDDATYAVAPGHGAGWGVTYRNDELGGDAPQHLAFLASTLGDLLAARSVAAP